MKSLALISLDLGRALAEKNGSTFRAAGTCMYPHIRPGDILTIQPRAVAGIALGEVAVCRSSSFLFGHRVIEKGEHQGRPYIITRSDRRKTGTDLPTYEEDILGVVTAIRRKGKSVRLLESTVDSADTSLYDNLVARLFDTMEGLRSRMTRSFALLAESVVWKTAARCWFVIASPPIAYSVRVPLNATLGDAVYRIFDPDTFNPEELISGKKLERWTLTLHVNGSRDADAWMVFVRNQPHSWSVAEANTRLRYRGADLQKRLMSRAESIIPTSFP